MFVFLICFFSKKSRGRYIFLLLYEKFEDTKGVIRSCKSKDRQYNGQKFEDPKGVTRSVNQRRIDNTMVDRKNDKRTNYDVQNTTQKTKY